MPENQFILRVGLGSVKSVFFSSFSVSVLHFFGEGTPTYAPLRPRRDGGQADNTEKGIPTD